MPTNEDNLEKAGSRYKTIRTIPLIWDTVRLGVYLIEDLSFLKNSTGDKKHPQKYTMSQIQIGKKLCSFVLLYRSRKSKNQLLA